MPIRSVREIFNSQEEDEKGIFWTYLICHVTSNEPFVYNLIRIDDCCEKMERLGCELPLDYCRQLIKSKEPSYD